MLHDYILAQKKKAAQGERTGFDGELNDFQSPQLSSLSKLVNALLYFYAIGLLLMRLWSEHGRHPALVTRFLSVFTFLPLIYVRIIYWMFREGDGVPSQ
jgi:hypothetical protein